MKQKIVQLSRNFQEAAVSALQAIDPSASLFEDSWKRDGELESNGGGGLTRVLEHGEVIEKGGVNFSEVSGLLDPSMTERLIGVNRKEPYYAVGTSIIIHPRSPMIPTVHANIRFLEVGGKSWFGGGCDLTPYYLFPEDCAHFHERLKLLCDGEDPAYYPQFKKACDEYFYLPHRNEARGIGGIFFDYLGKDETLPAANYYGLVKGFPAAFLEAYLPIVKRRLCEPWGDREKKFQLMRRGRYVEFNLLYDRGTLFGLKSKGRIESILVSMPPQVTWEYQPELEEGLRERETIQVLKAPREWCIEEREKAVC